MQLFYKLKVFNLSNKKNKLPLKLFFLNNYFGLYFLYITLFCNINEEDSTDVFYMCFT
jgi:hypothetical protein